MATTLIPLDTDHIEPTAEWLARAENYKWLDFGGGRQIIEPAALSFMMQRDTHDLRLYTDEAGVPIGLVALSDISHDFLTAILWYVVGEKSHSSRGLTSKAVQQMLEITLTDHKLHCVYAWALASNPPSIRILERNGFQRVGAVRQCHVVDGKRQDRIYFDLLSDEFLNRDE